MKKLAILALLGILSVFATATMANSTPLGGLAVALSPKDDILAAAGENRTLYVLNTENMEVVNRLWLGTCIIKLDFNKDGTVLLAEDTSGTLLSIDTKTWEVAGNRPKSEKMSAAREANRIAVLNPDYNGNIISFLDMTDLSEQGSVSFPKGQKIAALGLDASGERLGVLTQTVTDESETKEQAPSELRGLEKAEFKLKHDGKTSQFMVFAVPGGEKLWEQKVYYSPSMTGAEVLFEGEAGIVLNYTDVNAKITPEGEITLFELGNGSNYGIGVSPDQSIVLSGSLSRGTYTKLGTLNHTQFSPDKLQGWPEYFEDFAISSDGTAYGSTSAYRIIKIRPDRSFENSTPVF
ncbi:YncE family protein [Thiorhodovibrio frisius]|uniref:Uncharacterized protein n=1 Tax=Thiorhodovibrio frisius TaxID=631362 RepID=H8Z2H9_9GAMM|nr:hypothetical protein [Thiorhodovibrio frisius]EIC21634.1 hypothetical protein Thi970DRAFT_01850 [Thiorhodovibrio frisius]WPL21600.1 hypothetical protein Thiofri_01726 [Thiorhodovibrio frisius]